MFSQEMKRRLKIALEPARNRSENVNRFSSRTALWDINDGEEAAAGESVRELLRRSISCVERRVNPAHMTAEKRLDNLFLQEAGHYFLHTTSARCCNALVRKRNNRKVSTCTSRERD